MLYQIVAQCAQTLKNFEVCLDKAEQFAREKTFDVNVLMSSRLAPDQRDFVFQVQSACDYVKAAAAWLSGQRPPVHEDNERTVDEVRLRVRKTLDFAQGVSESMFKGATERSVSLSWKPGKVMRAEDYVLQMTIPNVYFHIVTAYAILRHNGVDIGKMDYLGTITFVDPF